MSLKRSLQWQYFVLKSKILSLIPRRWPEMEHWTRIPPDSDENLAEIVCSQTSKTRAEWDGLSMSELHAISTGNACAPGVVG